jgi:hypothetical protein
MLPVEAETLIQNLQDRLDAIRRIVGATADTDLRTILAEMLADGEQALALLIAENAG